MENFTCRFLVLTKRWVRTLRHEHTRLIKLKRGKTGKLSPKHVSRFILKKAIMLLSHSRKASSTDIQLLKRTVVMWLTPNNCSLSQYPAVAQCGRRACPKDPLKWPFLFFAGILILWILVKVQQPKRKCHLDRLFLNF